MKNRLEWFKDKYSVKIIEVYTTNNFTEVICKKGGDVHIFRIYGNSEENYIVTEK